jgi:hypothetical protein
MPPQGDDGVGIGELSRQVQEVFVRFERLAAKLESGQFVRADAYAMYQQFVDQAIRQLQDANRNFATSESAKTLKSEVDGKASEGALKGLEQRVSELEDDRKWLIRLVIGFVILGVMGALFAVGGR